MNSPTIGHLPWRCWCGFARMVGGDMDDDFGWSEVLAHRAEHKKDKKVVA